MPTLTNESSALSPNQLIAELSKSPHGDLNAYGPVISRVAAENGELLAHVIVHNLANGSIRDSKVALPVISMLTVGFPTEYRENSMAALASLSPREFLTGIRFARTLSGLRGWKPSMLTYDERMKTGNGKFRTVKKSKSSFTPITGPSRPGEFNTRQIAQLTERYLRCMESNRGRWERAALWHADSMRDLYRLSHTTQPEWVATLLWESLKLRREDGSWYREARVLPPNSVFADLRRLSKVSSQEAANIILRRNIPALIAKGALGKDASKCAAVALALIENMTPAQLTNQTRLLKEMGMDSIPEIRAAYTAGLARETRNAPALFKATVAADALAEELGEDNAIVVKLRARQERQLKETGGIEGDWLVLSDISISMDKAIETSRHVAGTLAKMVRGKVMLVFFNESPRVFDVTGMDYDQILKKTSTIRAGGNTSIGCGLLAAIENGMNIDGITIVSDGAENTAPYFADQYRALIQSTGKQVPVYLYRMRGQNGMLGDLAHRMASAGLALQEFDLRDGKVDYFGLPELIKTMSVKRYGLLQKIMDLELLTLDEVLPLTKTAKGV